MSYYTDITPTWYSDASHILYTAPCPQCGRLCDWTARQNEPQPHPHCPRCTPTAASDVHALTKETP